MDESLLREKIRKARKDLGLSQEAMADKLGLDRNTYGNIERGKTRLVYDHLDSILEILGLSLSELITGYDTPENSGDAALQDIKASYDGRIKGMVEEYEKKLGEDRAAIRDLRARISELEEMVRDKSEIISYQKARITNLESPEK